MKYYHIKDYNDQEIEFQLTGLFETAPEFLDDTWEEVMNDIVIEGYFVEYTRWTRVYYDGVIKMGHDLLDEFMRIISDEHNTPMYIKTTYY